MENGHINAFGPSDKHKEKLTLEQEKLLLDMENEYLEHLRDDPNDKQASIDYARRQKESKNLVDLLGEVNGKDLPFS